MGCCDIERVKGDFSEEELKRFYGDEELKDCCKNIPTEDNKKHPLLVWAIALSMIGIIVISLTI